MILAWMVLQAGAAPPLVAEPVEAPAAASAIGPSLVEAEDGAVILSWLQPAEGDEAQLLVARRAAGGGWTQPQRVASGGDWFVNWADFPAVSPGAGGTVLAAWLQRTGDAPYAYAPRLALRSAAGEEDAPAWTELGWLPRDDSAAEHGFVTLQALDGGGWGAAWLDGRHEDAMSLYAARIGPDGGVSGEARLDDRTCECCQTDSVLLPGGVMVVAYRDRGNEEVRDVAVVRGRPGEAGSWSEPRVPCPDGWVMPGCPVNGPALAARGSRVAMAWFTLGDDETPRVRVAVSADGGATFGEPVRVDDGNPFGRVDLRYLDDGALVVAWLEEEEAGVSWRARPCDGASGEPQQASVVIARVGGGRADGFLRLARVPGGLFAVWPRPAEDRPGAALLRRDGG